MTEPALAITAEGLLAGGVHLSRILHVDGPRGKKGWFMNRDRLVELPRVEREHTIMRETGEVFEHWYLDGEPVGELEDVVAILNGDTEHVPIAEQIQLVQALLSKDVDAQEMLLSGKLDRELAGALKTLTWCEENAPELRRYRASRALAAAEARRKT